MKNSRIIFGSLIATIAVVAGLALGSLLWQKRVPALPKAEVANNERGQTFGIDKNINEASIDKYLGRDDVVYRDMRMLEDPAEYENIDGDRFLSGIVEGFEVVSLPYLVNVEGLPEAVGKTYEGPTLYTVADGKYTANYKESKQILEDLFPKDKNIFLMCGGGGYAGMAKQMLVTLGWNADKIYVVGGYWYYEGEHNIRIKQDDGSFAFWKLAYHDIDFSKLTEVLDD